MIQQSFDFSISFWPLPEIGMFIEQEHNENTMKNKIK